MNRLWRYLPAIVICVFAWEVMPEGPWWREAGAVVLMGVYFRLFELARRQP